MTRLRRQYYRQARFSEGTAAQWAEENPVLYNGEPAFESDTHRLKVGNGIDNWADLEYLTAEADVGDVDHGDLTGLSDDDHPQYTLTAEAQAMVDLHTADTGDAHDASAISADSTTLVGTGTDVQAVLEELDNAVVAAAGDVVTHAAAGDPHAGYRLESADHSHATTGLQAGNIAATAVTVDSTNLDGTATNVQTVLEELETQVQLAASTHAGAADPHTGYLRESVMSEANAVDLTDGGSTVLHQHAAGAASVTVEEDNVNVGAALTLDFGTGFDLTFASDEAEIAIDLTELTAFTDHSARHEDGGADEISIAALSGEPAVLPALRAVDFLVGTATAELSGEIAVGTTPGGELGGTWASPTVDATHSGSAHLAFDDTGAPAAVSTAAADGTEGFPSRKDHVHPHETAHIAHDTLWAAANDYVRGTGNDTAAVQTASAATPAAVSTAGATGTAANPPSADDHVHAHEAAHLVHDTGWAALGDLIVGTANDTAAILSKGTQGQGLVVDTAEATDLKWVTNTITIGMLIDGGGSAISTGDYTVWRVPYACTVTAVRGYVDTGTTTVINAGKALSGTYFCSSNITIDPADAWEAGTVDQNATLAAGDTVYFDVITAGTATQLTIQVELARA